MNREDHRRGSTLMLARILTAFALLLVVFGANADSADDICFPLYAQAGAIPGDKNCESIAVSRISVGMGTYFCTGNAMPMIARYCNGPDPIVCDPRTTPLRVRWRSA